MTQIALLVFDEGLFPQLLFGEASSHRSKAHHCTASHPANRILRNFYDPLASTPGSQPPSILGLSASPIGGKSTTLEYVGPSIVYRERSCIDVIRDIERNLHAISKTPRLNRKELLRHVHLPDLMILQYSPRSIGSSISHSLERLRSLHDGLDIEQDPYVRRLRADASERRVELTKILLARKTYCFLQIKRSIRSQNS